MTVAELRALLEGVPAEWAGAPVLAVERHEYIVLAVDGFVVRGQRYLVFRIARELESGGGDRAQPLQTREANHGHQHSGTGRASRPRRRGAPRD